MRGVGARLSPVTRKVQSSRMVTVPDTCATGAGPPLERAFRDCVCLVGGEGWGSRHCTCTCRTSAYSRARRGQSLRDADERMCAAARSRIRGTASGEEGENCELRQHGGMRLTSLQTGRKLDHGRD